MKRLLMKYMLFLVCILCLPVSSAFAKESMNLEKRFVCFNNLPTVSFDAHNEEQENSPIIKNPNHKPSDIQGEVDNSNEPIKTM